MGFNIADVLKAVPELDTGREQIEYIYLSLIDGDSGNFYSLSEIESLANNIATIGLQQPLRLRKNPAEEGRYLVVSGHRRREALMLLAKDEPERWSEVACIVQGDTVSPAMQQLRLIFANSDTRKMSSADISEQAVQVEKLLYQLKEEGHEFPGRMRDHVAQVVQVSKSKLARLKVIREKLTGVWQSAWNRGEINESVAYALAQIPDRWQTIIYSQWGIKPESLQVDMVSRFCVRFEKSAKIKCEHGLQVCEHAVTMMTKNCKESWCEPCSCCCFDCSSLPTCENCCSQANGKKKEMKAAAKEAQREQKMQQEELDRPGSEFARLVWQRAGLARANCGATVEAAVLARGESYYSSSYNDPKQQKMENGEGEYTPRTPTPFGCSIPASDLMKVVAVADTLHCSVDYLLGRTEKMQLDPEQGTDETELVPNLDTMWHPITEEPPTGVDLVWLDGCGYSDTAQYLGGQRIETRSTIPWCDARYWAFLPKED